MDNRIKALIFFVFFAYKDTFKSKFDCTSFILAWNKFTKQTNINMSLKIKIQYLIQKNWH